MKCFTLFSAIFFPIALHAAEVSDECLHSMQSLYKYYYHEIQPKKGMVAQDPMSEKESTDMQYVVSELKTHCPPPLITKMNQYLQEENASS